METKELLAWLWGAVIQLPAEQRDAFAFRFEDPAGAREPLYKFWKQHQRKLKEIRTMSAAHRDLDGLSLLESIDSINIAEVAQLGLQIDSILNDIADVVQSVINECSRISPPEMNAS